MLKLRKAMMARKKTTKKATTKKVVKEQPMTVEPVRVQLSRCVKHEGVMYCGTQKVSPETAAVLLELEKQLNEQEEIS